MIKKIYTFGTSFTEGGGFEFHGDRYHFLKPIYRNIDEEYTQFNFSYPGQLQKLLPDTKVINFAKSAFGNERMYRIAIDLILSDNFNSETSVFVIEASHLGRKEYFSNKLNDFIIVNYDCRDNDNIELNGFARTVLQKQDISEFELSKLPSSDFFKKLLKTTIDIDASELNLIQNMIMFLNFLNEHNIKYIFTDPPSYLYMESEKNTFDLNYMESHLIKSLYKDSIYHECTNTDNDMGTISKETLGVHDDGHYGLIGNKVIASKIYDEFVNRGWISKSKLNTQWSEFKYLHEIIISNVIKLKS